MWRLASEPLCQLNKQTAQDYNVIIELEACVMFIQSASLGIMAGIREGMIYISIFIEYDNTGKMSSREKD